MANVDNATAIRVYVNGIHVPHVIRVSVSYRQLPQLCGATVTIADPDQQYIVGRELAGYPVAETPTFVMLRDKALEKFGALPHRCPVFYDGDVIAMFRRDRGTGEWMWAFHGYITNAELSDLASGAATITLAAESGLKSMRYNYLLMNSFMTPTDIQGLVDEMKSHVASVPTSNLSFYDKIKTVFQGPDAGDVRDSNDRAVFGEGSYTLADDVDAVLRQPSDVGMYIRRMQARDGTGTYTAPDLDVVAEAATDPTDKVVYIVSIASPDGAAAGMQVLHDYLFAQFHIQSPVYTVKLQILSDILAPLGYVGHTLPSGDVVFEPMLNGIIGGPMWVGNMDLLGNAPLSYTGSNLMTAALVNETRRLPGIPGAQMAELWKTMSQDTVIKDDRLIDAHGLRIVQVDSASPNITSTAQRDFYGKLLLSRAYGMTRTTGFEFSTYNRRHISGLNRPVYVQKYDAWALIQELSWTANASGAESASVSLGHMLMWNGSEWSMGASFATSSLAFLLDVAASGQGAPKRPGQPWTSRGVLSASDWVSAAGGAPGPASPLAADPGAMFSVYEAETSDEAGG